MPVEESSEMDAEVLLPFFWLWRSIWAAEDDRTHDPAATPKHARQLTLYREQGRKPGAIGATDFRMTSWSWSRAAARLLGGMKGR
jgi:hypothetical protein